MNVTWANKSQTIIHYQMEGEWNWKNFEDMCEMGFNMTESVSHTVNALIDLSQNTKLPDGALLYFKQMLKALPKNQQAIVFVATEKLVLTAINLFLGINKRSQTTMTVVENIKQAMILLESHNPTGKTILVIEDEEELREEIVDVLKYEGYQTLEADNGLSGLKLAQRHLPSMIISDISMPAMDGFQVLEEVRKRPQLAHIPVILLTARVDRSFVRYGMELGADDYITKPFSNSEITTAIKVRLERLHTVQSR